MLKNRIFKTRLFSQWLNKSKLTDENLLIAINEMEQGLYDANLGGHVYKKRVALGNRGKSHGARTIVATKFSHLWFFIFGFEKNQRSNINNAELAHLQAISERLLHLTAQEIDTLVKDKILTEIKYDNDKKIQPHH
jgi:hypothetical protein